MKKLISILLAAAMLLSLAACSQTAAENTQDEETTTQSEQSDSAQTEFSSQTPPEKPDGAAPAMADGQTPPEKPDGSQPGTPPDGAPNGQPGSFGGSTVSVDSGSYTSNGYNSPAVYSTAAITVKNAALTANNSEALVIEGKNSIALEDCTVSGNMSSTKGTSSDENVHTVMIYQSMSGDADVGTSVFSMTGGSLTGKNGDLFYITNTHCVLTLSGVTLKNEDASGYLMRICGNSASHGWGTAGSNGAQVEMTCEQQTLSGNILVDTISALNLTLKNGSSFTGTINITDNAEGGTAVSDNAVVTIESGCTWTLTGDCTVLR